jgi:hypothetical protein
MVKGQFSDLLGRDREWFTTKAWARQTWRPRPALQARNRLGSLELYTGQDFDSAEYELLDDAWSHDHCPLCGEEISDLPQAMHHEGYVHEGEWICPLCYERWVSSGAPPAA